MTIADMPVGRTACVSHVDGADGLALRLMELGFTPGTPVTLTGTAPGGDPLLLCLRDFRLSLSRREASLIHLREETHDPHRSRR